jgi:[acyl-carrier-protein] S-malonyltransferase
MRRTRRASVRASRSVTVRAAADYSPKKAFFFPGQGAQTVGMAKELCEECPAAKAMFDTASGVLGYDLLDVCVNGPAERLNSTAVSQPAIYVSSLAALEKMKMSDEGKAMIDSIDVAAGLSLGEYTALTFAEALSFEDGLKLVKIRGESMQEAADATPSGMASVIGLSADKAEELAARAAAESGAPCSVANYLCNGNYAVSGAIPAIDKVEEIAKPEFKARMVVRLAVAGAFHTDFMAPAADKLKAALEATPIKEPRIPVISNVDVNPHTDAASIRATLAKQLTNPVQWETTMTTLLGKGLESATEVGPGKVISGIMKRVDKAFACDNFTV